MRVFAKYLFLAAVLEAVFLSACATYYERGLKAEKEGLNEWNEGRDTVDTVHITAAMKWFKKALNYYTKAIKKDDPLSPRLYNRRGMLRLRIEAPKFGGPEEAARDFNITLEIDPHYKWARWNLIHTKVPQHIYFDYLEAQKKIEEGDYDRAIKELSRIIETYPYYLYAYNERGKAHEATGDLDKAMKDFNEMRVKDTGNVLETLTLENIGRIYYKMEDYQKAVMYYQQAIKRSKDERAEGEMDPEVRQWEYMEEERQNKELTEALAKLGQKNLGPPVSIPPLGSRVDTMMFLPVMEEGEMVWEYGGGGAIDYGGYRYDRMTLFVNDDDHIIGILFRTYGSGSAADASATDAAAAAGAAKFFPAQGYTKVMSGTMAGARVTVYAFPDESRAAILSGSTVTLLPGVPKTFRKDD